MRLRYFTIALVAAGALVVVLPAAAKEGVKATLLTRIPVDAPAGARLEVAWKLFSIGEHGRHEPFNAGGVFVRVRSASGAAAQEGFARGAAQPAGVYRAAVVVPKGGGIGDVEIGLMGWTNGPNGTRRAGVFFPITNDPLPGNGRVVPPGAARNSTTWVFAAGVPAVVAALGIALLALRRRGRRSLPSSAET